MRVGVLSDIGKRREKNEDGYLVEGSVFAVADGMGGHTSGEIASATALGTIRQNLSQIPDARHMPQWLTHSIQEANTAVYQQSETEVKNTGMGTTLTLSVLLDNQLFVGHVGDSRAYSLRDKGLKQITEDHTWVAEMVKKGALSAEEAETHPQRSILTRALGIGEAVPVDIASSQVKQGDKILLCTDGLTSMLGDEQVEEIMNEPSNPQSICQKLVDAANQEGGYDNITVIVIEIEDLPESGTKSPWWKGIFR